MQNELLNRLGGDRLQSRQVDELIGLARGLVADGSLNEAEVRFLEGWLATNLSISHQPLIATLYDRVREIMADGQIDEDECRDLFEALSRFSAGDAEVGEAPKSTSLPFCEPAPSLTFAGMAYCFTGTFSYGQRKDCAQAVTDRGASSGSLTKSTNVLVIGSYATESWKHSSFGNKILKAVDLRAKGLPLSIVSEQHWKSHL